MNSVRRSRNDKGTVGMMAIALLLLVLSWVDITLSHQLIKTRQNAEAEIKTQLGWASRDLWELVDQWVTQTVTRPTTGGPTTGGLCWDADQSKVIKDGTINQPADPCVDNEGADLLWRSANLGIVGRELLPSDNTDTSPCEATTPQPHIAVCWRVHEVLLPPSSSSVMTMTLVLAVGVGCTHKPDIANPKESGCNEISYSSRQYDKTQGDFIDYMVHYDTSEIGDTRNGWPLTLTSLEDNKRLAFREGFKFTGPYHTNETTFYICNKVEGTATLTLSRKQGGSLGDFTNLCRPKPTPTPPAKPTVKHTLPLHVASGLVSIPPDKVSKFIGIAKTAPSCSQSSNPSLQSSKYYLPPGSAWLAEAQAVALSKDKPPKKTVFLIPDADTTLNLSRLEDGDVIWLYSSDPDINPVIEGALPEGFTVTIATPDSVTIKGSLDNPMNSALAIMAGCNVKLTNDPTLTKCGQTLSGQTLTCLSSPDNIVIHNVAVIAPGGVVYAEHALTLLQCRDTRNTEATVPCTSGNAEHSDSSPTITPIITWNGSIASKYKTVFGQTDPNSSEIVSGYSTDMNWDSKWPETRFPWWPKLLQGGWQPS